MFHAFVLIMFALVAAGWGWMARDHFKNKEYKDMNYCLLWMGVSILIFLLEVLWPGVGTL